MANGSPHLADATDVERWADQRSAQADLPRLVRRLIRQENDQVQRVEMRGGDGVGAPGYDGIVEATRSTSFVPDGLSVWEMGVGNPPADKATEDYNTRTADSLGVDMATSTFVFITPRRWKKKKDWEQKRRDEGKWRDVRVLDADDIEQALDVAPATRIWFSELLDMPALGAVTIEDWWRRFSNGFEPLLTPGVVLAGRADQSALLLRRLAQDVGRTFVKAATVDDGLAFVACSMMAAGAEDAEPMLSRSLLVHDGITLRRLDSAAKLLILLPYDEHLQREARLVENHHVVFIVTDDGNGDIDLPPLDHLALQAALRDAGVPEQELARYVRAGNKSLQALQRVATRFGQADPEAWLRDMVDRVVRRAWLAGSWNQQRSGDVDVVADLTGSGREELEERLHQLVRQPDPLFTRVGSTFAVAAPEDSWRVARHAITDADLDALERAAQTVLGAVDPSLELPPDERWRAAIHGRVRIHSSDLRSGLARSVALMGARGDQVRLSGGRTGRQWAERLVWRLLDRANQSDTTELWESIEDVLPLLAEAAPDVFLRAVSEATAGTEPKLRGMFQDRTEDWNASSPHTGLLWALEGVAWSVRHFGLASELLAKLAELDPGGRLSNRPTASLRDVFRPWLPQTSAPAEVRLRTLDALVERHKEVAWPLLLDLLPEHSAVGMESYKPRYRDWAERNQPVTQAEYVSVIGAVSERIVGIATKEPARWAAVVEHFDRFPASAREAIISGLNAIEQGGPNDDVRVALWTAIDAFVRRNREYADADWAAGEQWLSQLAATATRLRPQRPSDVHRWLFNDWHPEIGVPRSDELEVYDEEVRRLRVAAVREVLVAEGFGAVRALAETVELPWAVGAVLTEVSTDFDSDVVSLLDSPEARLVQFAEGFARARTQGEFTVITLWLERFAARPLVQARLLQLVDDVTIAWRTVAELGPNVEKAYWAEFMPYGRGKDFPYVSDAARQLLRYGRTAMAVDALSMYAERLSGGVDVEVVIDALRQFGTVEDVEASRVSEHDLQRLLEYLRKRGLDDVELAGLEWKFFPVLRRGSRTPSLERLLARDPEFFVSVISFAFKSKTSETPNELRQVDPTLASNAYRLLREWRIIPGSDEKGTVDAATLKQWLTEARERLTESDRLEIGELQIGEVFAHAPADPDGTFPTKPVRDILENAPNDRLERGFVVGLFNKRGVTTRGMTDGGKQEYDLADQYDRWAAAIEPVYPRTAAALRTVADGYRNEGRRNDEEARRFLEGLDG